MLNWRPKRSQVKKRSNKRSNTGSPNICQSTKLDIRARKRYGVPPLLLLRFCHFYRIITIPLMKKREYFLFSSLIWGLETHLFSVLYKIRPAPKLTCHANVFFIPNSVTFLGRIETSFLWFYAVFNQNRYSTCAFCCLTLFVMLTY